VRSGAYTMRSLRLVKLYRSASSGSATSLKNDRPRLSRRGPALYLAMRGAIQMRSRMRIDLMVALWVFLTITFQLNLRKALILSHSQWSTSDSDVRRGLPSNLSFCLGLGFGDGLVSPGNAVRPCSRQRTSAPCRGTCLGTQSGRLGACHGRTE
jgi:hypothetical protein